MKLQEISWPVYKLGDKKPNTIDGVCFYLHESPKGQFVEVVDDTTIEGSSLATRRMKLGMQNVKLYKIKFAVFFIADLIKLAKKGVWFIDSTGKVFQYTKTKFVPLVFKKITNTIRDISCYLIEVEGSSARYKTLYPPQTGEKYAGLLVLGKGYVLYGFYDTLHETTYRKI
jgi:hypothetical protein